MKFGPARGSILYIFDSFFVDFGLLLLAIVFTVMRGPEVLLDNAFLFAITIFKPVQRYLKYLSTYYSIDEYKMTVETGILTKKKMEIPLEAVTTVDFSQNVVYQLFHVYKLKIDNASLTNDLAEQSEVSISLKKEQAFLVKELLLSKQSEAAYDQKQTIEGSANGHFDKANNLDLKVIRANMKDFVILGLLQSKLAYAISFLPILFGLLIFIVQTMSGVSDSDKVIDILFLYFGSLTPMVSISMFVLVTIMAGLVPSIITAVMKYYNFRITDNGDALHIEFGLFTKKSYRLIQEKISGITLRQTFLMQLFGFAAAEIFVIGYGDKSDDGGQEIALLYPIMKLDKLKDIIHIVLPNLSLEGEYKRAARQSLRYFFWCPRFILAVCFVIAAVFTELWWLLAIAIVFLACITLSVILEHRNSGFFASSNTILFSSGAFRRNRNYIKTEKIESVSEHSFVLKRKKGITSISLGFVGPLRVSNVKVKNLTFEDFEVIYKAINY